MATESKSFRVELREAWDHIKEARQDKKVTLAEALKILAESCQAMERLCTQYGGNDAEFEQLVLDAEWAAQEFLVKPDLRFMNDFVERTFIDPQLVPLVRPFLTSIRPAKDPA